jgi:uncharacterized protein (DUF305 family)
VRSSTIIGALLVGSLALAGCTPSEKPSDMPRTPGTPPPAAAQEHSSGQGQAGHAGERTDQEFAQRMLGHQQKALELAGLAAQNSQDPRIKDLAARIQQAQRSDIDKIQAWLSTAPGHQPGGAPEGSETEQAAEGLPNPETMQRLRQARGVEFDQLWMQAMLSLQEGAVQIARDEVDEGSVPQMRDLAQKIVTTRQAEIDQLQTVR